MTMRDALYLANPVGRQLLAASHQDIPYLHTPAPMCSNFLIHLRWHPYTRMHLLIVQLLLAIYLIYSPSTRAALCDNGICQY